MKKVYIETLGCQMNKSDTENILGMLELTGYEETDQEKNADLLIINTCTIRGSAEDKAFSYLGVWGKMKKSKPNLKIAVCGCVAQQKKDIIFKRAPFVDLVFGTHNINELPMLIKKIDGNYKKECSIHTKPYQGDEIEFKAKRESNLTAWVTVIEGCDYFCTYCVVPYVRGRQRSKPFNKIVDEVKYLVDKGYKEVTLLGQTVDSYGKDLDDSNANLSNLLSTLNAINDLARIRFVTSHPVDITDELIYTVRDLEKVCEYFHIPMQSGNTEILKAMKRGYTAEEYYDLVYKIKSEIKNVAITSDFIVAFPGETEEQFQDTIKAVRELKFDQCNTAMYSPRKQTPAATWKSKQLSDEIKKERINLLNAEVKESARQANIPMLGQHQDVLVESYLERDNIVSLTGRTRNNKLTHFIGSKELVGSLVNVKITETTAWSLKAELL